MKSIIRYFLVREEMSSNTSEYLEENFAKANSPMREQALVECRSRQEETSSDVSPSAQGEIRAGGFSAAEVPRTAVLQTGGMVIRPFRV